MADAYQSWIDTILKHGSGTSSPDSLPPVDPGTVSIQIVGSDGKPLAHVEVTLEAAKREGETGLDGLVTFDDLPGGSYRAKFVFDGGEKPVRKAAEVESVAGQSKQYKFKLPALQERLAADLSDDDFWKDLETRAAEGLHNWLNTVFGGAIEEFSDDLSKKESKDGDVRWSLTKDVLSFVPGTSIPLKVADIGKNLGQLLPTSSSSLEDFLHEARRGMREIGRDIMSRSHPGFRELKQLASGAQKDDPTYRSKADSSVKRVLRGLATHAKLMKAMVRDWVNSSSDNWDGFDYGGVEAGYLWTVAEYDQRDGSWNRIEGPFIDDVDKSQGVRKALEHSYGKNFAVAKLPFPAKARLTIRIDPKNISKDHDMIGRLKDREASMIFLLRKESAGPFTQGSHLRSKNMTIGDELGEALFDHRGIPSAKDAVKLFNEHYGALKITDLTDD